MDYGTWDVVPVESSAKLSNQASDTVYAHGHLYNRKRVPVYSDNSNNDFNFIMQLKGLTTIQHPHLESIWATYSQDDFNYILLTPPTGTTLKTFLEDQPNSFKLLEKQQRRHQYLSWVHCLTSALAYLHEKGYTHQTIRPATITIDHTNTIYLSDYRAIKALDRDDPPAPYSGELYEYAAPENWRRKPQLHETAASKTLLPGGGRTSRRIPKAANAKPINPKASLPEACAPISLTRVDSKSASSTSNSSAQTSRPRNTLITTFAPPHRSSTSSNSASAPGHNKLQAADVFSLTAVLITILSMILKHTPKSFASHRSRLNRQAGRGNAPPDASFHKNLGQVTKWLDMLVKEAGHREKKDVKLWGSVVEIVQLCRLGINKEAKYRIGARELEYRFGGWVEWGLGKKRRCQCELKKSQNAEAESIDGGQLPMERLLDEQMLGYGDSKFERSDSRDQHWRTQTGPDDDISRRESTVWGLGDLKLSDTTCQGTTIWGGEQEPQSLGKSQRPASFSSDEESAVWGLGDVRDDEELEVEMPAKSAGYARTSWIAIGDVDPTDDDDYDSDDGYVGKVALDDMGKSNDNWPLPTEALVLNHAIV